MKLFKCQVCNAVFKRLKTRRSDAIAQELAKHGWVILYIDGEYKWACKACQRELSN